MITTSKRVIKIGCRHSVTLVWVHIKACGVVLNLVSIAGLCSGCNIWVLRAQVLVARGDDCPRVIQIATSVLTVAGRVEMGNRGGCGKGSSGVRRLCWIFCGWNITVLSIPSVAWRNIRGNSRLNQLIIYVIWSGGPFWARIPMRHNASFDCVQPERSWVRQKITQLDVMYYSVPEMETVDRTMVAFVS
jgi:hypothetical protein